MNKEQINSLFKVIDEMDTRAAPALMRARVFVAMFHL